MMKPRPSTGRRFVDKMVSVWSVISALIGIGILVWILSGVITRGIGAINLSFFTQLPTPPGMPGGGLANAILGTLAMTVAATLLSVPIGLLAGIYLAEFGQDSRVADQSRFSSNVLMGIPSIIVGVFAYTLVVLPLGHFSGYAGVVALAILMMPVITRTTEDMLRLVPNTLRESALALGERPKPAYLPGFSWPWPGSAARPHPCCLPPSIVLSGSTRCRVPPPTSPSRSITMPCRPMMTGSARPGGPLC